MHVATKSELQADGSSVADAHPTVEIDLENEADRWRFTCPRGHHAWDRTNSHAWCHPCSKQAQHDDSVTPEYYELLDQKTGELVPWSAIDVDGDSDNE